MRQDYICVKVHRYYERDKKPEPVPEPVVTAQPPAPTMKPKQPLDSPPPKPQPRIVTIKEVEGEYADRRHWMS
jgi:hypothetical protein